MKKKKESQKIIDNIYAYNSYRHFLDDYFTTLKRENRLFSYTAFTKKIGVKSANLMGLIIRAERNISLEIAEKVCDVLQLKLRKERYFLLMVKYNQAKKAIDADRYFSEMKKIKKVTGEYNLPDKQFEYYDKWYYPVIKEIVSWYPWNNDYAILAKTVSPPITKTEAKIAVEVLERIGLIEKMENGTYRQTKENICGDNVPVHRKKIIREEILNLGIQATGKFNKEERYTTFHTVSLDDERYEKAVKIIQEAEARLYELVNDIPNEEQKVYEIVFNAFPVSKQLKDSKGENV